MNPRVLLRVLILATAVSGCRTMAQPDQERVPGVIEFHQDPVVVSAPEAAQAGIPFEVAVRTYGGGCVSQGETEVTVDGSTVDVTPYDVVVAADVCTTELRLFDHRVRVSIASRGTATIRFHGRSVPADSMILVTRAVRVQ